MHDTLLAVILNFNVRPFRLRNLVFVLVCRYTIPLGGALSRTGYVIVVMDHKQNVVLFGHSFIRRLGRFADSCDKYYNLRLDNKEFNVSFRAQGGLTFKRLFRNRETSRLVSFESTPDIIFLQIGGNDASSHNRSASQIAADIFSLALYFVEGLQIRSVIIGQLVPRCENATFEGYNKKITVINNLVQEKIEEEKLVNIKFWHHRGFWTTTDFLGFDGVHLNHFGIRRYFKSVRSSILYASSH